MPIFAVLADPDFDQSFSLKVAEVFPNDHRKVRPGQWLIAARGTAVDVSAQLDITVPSPTGTKSGTRLGMVLTISSYYGRADPQIWEWIRTKWSIHDA